MKSLLTLTLLLATSVQADPWPDVDALLAGSDYFVLMTSPFPASAYKSSARDIWVEIERRRELRVAQGF
jgi:hypothetical protein